MRSRFSVATKLTAILLAGYWIALFAGTHLPARVLGEWNVWDKGLHAAAYAGLAFLLATAMFLRRRPGWSLYAVLLTVVLAYGAVDELAQTLVPGRTASAEDWLADLVGAVAGLSLHRLAWWGCGWLLPALGKPNQAGATTLSQ